MQDSKKSLGSKTGKKNDSPRRKEGIAQAGSETLETLEALTTMYDKDIDLSEGEKGYNFRGNTVGPVRAE